MRPILLDGLVAMETEQHPGVASSMSNMEQLNLVIPEDLPSPLYSLEDIPDVDLTFPGIKSAAHILGTVFYKDPKSNLTLSWT